MGGKIGSVAIAGDLVGGAGVGAGSVYVSAANGGMGKVAIGGNQSCGTGTISGSVIAEGTAGNIAGVTIAGDATTSGGYPADVLATGELGPVTIKKTVRGLPGVPYIIKGGGALTGPSSTAIASVAIGGSLEYGLLLGGFGAELVPINGHAQIGAITVGGDWIASTVTAGVVDQNGGIAKLGIGDQFLIAGGSSTAVSSIASIAIKGNAMGTLETDDNYGILAEEIGSVSIHGTKLALKPGAGNDTTPIQIGPTPDFFLLEVNH